MHKTIFFFILWLTLVFPHGINAAAKADLRLIERIQNRYEQTSSFDAGFEQKLTHKESGAVTHRKGRLQFHKPLLINWQTEKPEAETLVINDKEIWDYLPDEKVAYRYAPEMVKNSSSIIQVITGQAALNRDFDVRDGGQEKGLAKLVLYPREPSTQLVEAQIWVDPETGFIKRGKIMDFYGNTNDINFTRFTPDASISSANFKFSPPKGIDVEDRVKNADDGKEFFK